jgi:hypothetical protein
MVGVTGSIPVAPTISFNGLASPTIQSQSKLSQPCHSEVSVLATIRKRESKWQVQVRRKGCPPASRSFPARRDAVEWARQVESLADRRGLRSDPRALDNLTLGDLLVRYRDTVAIAKRSAPVETVTLTAFLRHRLASVSLASLSPSHFSAYRDERLGQVESARSFES